MLVSWASFSLCDIGDPYGLISRVQTECEMSSMTFGTRLSDAFNSLDESTSNETRIHHEYLVEHLGFSSFHNSSLWKHSEVGVDGHTVTQLQKACYFLKSFLLYFISPIERWLGSSQEHISFVLLGAGEQVGLPGR